MREDLAFASLVAPVGSLLTAERSTFNGEEGRLDVGTTKVGTRWGFRDIVLRDDDGEPWLVATGRPQPKPPQIPDSPELLLSLLTRVKQPVRWDQLDEAVAAADALKWCQQRGLPAVEAIIRDVERPGLSLGLFRRETVTLTLLCGVWTGLVCEDATRVARNLPELLKACAHQREGVSDAWRAAIIEEASTLARLSPREKKVGAKRYIHPLIEERLKRIHPNLRLYPTASSLFDICYLQFASLRTNPADEVKRHYRYCKRCHGGFWAEGKVLYCDDDGCNRKNAWAERHGSPKT